MRYVDFKGAILRSANFTGADLSFADFTGTDIEGATFRDAILKMLKANPENSTTPRSSSTRKRDGSKGVKPFKLYDPHIERGTTLSVIGPTCTLGKLGMPISDTTRLRNSSVRAQAEGSSGIASITARTLGALRLISCHERFLMIIAVNEDDDLVIKKLDQSTCITGVICRSRGVRIENNILQERVTAPR